MRKTTMGTFLAAALIAALLAGCQTSKPGVSNSFGTIEAMVDAGPVKTTEAAKAALEELKLSIISSGATELDGQVVARTATDTKVEVWIKRAGDNVSQVNVRVGTLGDEAVSLSILERINAKLGGK